MQTEIELWTWEQVNPVLGLDICKTLTLTIHRQFDDYKNRPERTPFKATKSKNKIFTDNVFFFLISIIFLRVFWLCLLRSDIKKGEWWLLANIHVFITLLIFLAEVVTRKLYLLKKISSSSMKLATADILNLKIWNWEFIFNEITGGSYFPKNDIRGIIQISFYKDQLL